MVQYRRFKHFNFILLPMLSVAFMGLLTSCTNTVPTVSVLRSKLENYKVEVRSSKTKLKVSQSANVTAVGGLAPYTYLVLEKDQGSVDASGLYTAPLNTSQGTKATVRATDSLGNFADVEISIYDEMSVTASAPKLAVNNVSTLEVSGGVPPYRFSVDTGGGVVDAAGIYTAPSGAGRYTVQVADSDGNSAQISLEVAEALQISPGSTASLFFAQVQNFAASGGVPPYSFSLVGGGTIDPATGVYTAQAPAGLAKVRVQDSLRNTSEIEFSVQQAVVTIASPAEGSYINTSNQANLVVSGSCSENGLPVMLSVLGQSAATVPCLGGLYSHSFDFSGVLDGNVRLEVGQTGATPVVVNLQKDTLAPSLFFTSPDMLEAYSSNVTLIGVCDEDGQNVMISVGGTTTSTACAGSAFEHPLSLSSFSQGTFTIAATIKDLAGNISSIAKLNLIKDSVAPTVPSAITLDSAYAGTTETPLIQWGASTDITTSVRQYLIEIYDSSNNRIITKSTVTNSIKITGLTLTANTQYKVQIRAVDMAENYSSYSVFSNLWTATSNPCPVNYLFIPSQAGSTTPGFCIAKYEMKKSPTNYLAVPVPEGLPWTLPRDGNTNSAVDACDALGPGFELISNEQWNVVARNIASVSENWNTGILYSGTLNRGHVFDAPKSPLAAINDDSQGCYGISGIACLDGQWYGEKRTHKLSNGNTIWDFSGNVWEWVQGSMIANVSQGPVSQFANNSDMQINYGTNLLCNSPSSPNFCGYGRAVLVSGSSYDAIVRGGVYNYSTASGVFASYLGLNPSDISNSYGFRCVFDPNFINDPGYLTSPYVNNVR